MASWIRGSLLAFLLLLAPGLASAQVLSGVVTSDADGSPLQGAVVELLGPTGDRVAARLTGPDGRFSFQDLPPARYAFRVGLLGYRTVGTDPFELGPGQDLHRRVAIPLDPIRLDGIQVAGSGRCGGDFAGTDLVRLWEEARKGLMAVVLTESSPLVSFRTAIYDRELDAVWKTVLDERVRTQRTWGNDPFRSVSPDSLLAEGFVRARADTLTYFGPDAQLLLSEPFLQQYCFGITRHDDEVGLTFEPETRLRGVAQIEGVLWLDAATAGLKRLEFSHTWSPVRSFEPRGSATYERLPTGAWIIREWQLRLPRPAIVNGLPTSSLGGIHETSGEVVEVLGLDRAMRLQDPPGAVRGHVVADGTDEPLGNVLVYLAGTDLADTTDLDGSYRIDQVRPGRYTVAWANDQLDRAAASTPEPVDVVSGRDAVVDLYLPLPPLLAAGCTVSDGAAVWGRVVDRATGVPLRAVEVELVPAGPDGGPGDEAAIIRRGTDARGTFRFCGVTPGPFAVRARLGDGDPALARVTLAPDSALKVELRVTAAAPGDRPGRVIGRILDAATDTAMAGVTVRVDGETRGVSDVNGAFLVDRLPPGSHTVSARTLGYGEASGAVEVGSGQSVTIEIRLGYQPIALDPITVTASRTELRMGRMADFTRRLEQGWGTYVLQDEIEERHPARLIHVLQTAGFQVRNNDHWLINPRHQCAPMVYVDGIAVTYQTDRDSGDALVEAANAVNMIHPMEVAGIEIYRGASEVPGAFAGSNARCGVIVIWTRGYLGGPVRREGESQR